MAWRSTQDHALPWHNLGWTWSRLGLESCPMKMTSQHGKIREITPLCPKSIIYSKMHTANIQMLHACVKPEGNIQGLYRPKVHAQEYLIIGSKTLPVMCMTCFTSQLMNLRPSFVRPPVPRQVDHVIRHMVRYNTEAYAHR